MKIGIIQFPGSNCERETAIAVHRAGMEPHHFLWNQDPTLLATFDGFVIVGGFSYEDRSRAGIIAALDPVMQVISEQSELGKPVLGICNGAQILVETGLVPGIEHNRVGVALTDNKRIQHGKILGTGYYNEWVHMRLCEDYQRNAFTRHLTKDTVLHVPVAHGEGRFVVSDALWQELSVQGLGLFQYCDEKGNIIDHFPVNPNGSHANLAGISNKRGNVLALMPHPERTMAGDPLFRSMRDYIADGHVNIVTPLTYYPRFESPLKHKYQKAEGSASYLIASIVTDNAALTVEATLQKLGYDVSIKRYVHWEIDNAHTVSYDVLESSGVIFNPRKEYVVRDELSKNESVLRFLVRPKEDMQGQETAQVLRDHFSCDVASIMHGILWEVTVSSGNPKEICDAVLATHIFHNPYAHDCFHYANE